MERECFLPAQDQRHEQLWTAAPGTKEQAGQAHWGICPQINPPEATETGQPSPGIQSRDHPQSPVTFY